MWPCLLGAAAEPVQLLPVGQLELLRLKAWERAALALEWEREQEQGRAPAAERQAQREMRRQPEALHLQAAAPKRFRGADLQSGSVNRT